MAVKFSPAHARAEDTQNPPLCDCYPPLCCDENKKS